MWHSTSIGYLPSVVGPTLGVASFAECLPAALGEISIFFVPLAFKLFLYFSYGTWYSILNFDTFLDPFAIFKILISFKGISRNSQI